MAFSLRYFRHHKAGGSNFEKGSAIMRPSKKFAQSIVRKFRQTVRWATRDCNHHWAGYLALAAVHAAIGSIQAANGMMPEAMLTWLAAIIYTALAFGANHHA
jgi:hypothetical protein